ncbi:unnamed protein product [Rotaria sp. Silwood1]|nr:unnamed protein product [Rotaria sp. Silwood1]CAF1690984.1 unnamed protein product [Rotaria sp. Silwood1]CAF3962345.1 unnamed protein product [Rotaria sp. Silwood1]CAF4948290.1 unnamed protein product [Rotaria sp. Silwood1]CAF5091498.1 unnamed protein product [Rotaria sp. Silwood1]
MLPLDYYCASVKKELKRRTCKACNQYIPSAYRMKNHYKIHAQNYENFDHDQDDKLPSLAINDIIDNSDESQSITTAALVPVVRIKMFVWLRSDFDEFDSSSTAAQLANNSVTRFMKKLCVKENNDESERKDLVHLE